jgi:hypothetical protein
MAVLLFSSNSNNETCCVAAALSLLKTNQTTAKRPTVIITPPPLWPQITNADKQFSRTSSTPSRTRSAPFSLFAAAQQEDDDQEGHEEDNDALESDKEDSDLKKVGTSILRQFTRSLRFVVEQLPAFSLAYIALDHAVTAISLVRLKRTAEMTIKRVFVLLYSLIFRRKRVLEKVKSYLVTRIVLQAAAATVCTQASNRYLERTGHRYDWSKPRTWFTTVAVVSLFYQILALLPFVIQRLGRGS